MSRSGTDDSGARKVEFVAGATSLDQLPKRRLPEVAIIGPSNVGKSSLVNALVGQKGVARVSKTPGRTQQLNFFRIDDRFDLVDLPGYGYAKAPKAVQDAFLMLIEEYLANSEHLKLLLFLQDCRRTPSEKDLVFHRWLVESNVPHAVVLTKSDKLRQGELAKQSQVVRRAFRLAEGVRVQAISTQDGSGRQQIWRIISEALSASPRSG